MELEEKSSFVYPKFPDLKEVSTTVILIDDFEEAIGTPENGFLDESFRLNESLVSMQISYKYKIENYKALINRRGATSYIFDKPQLSVSFVDDDGLQIAESVMDMPKGEDWVLNGPFLDRSMIRNYLAYKTAFEIMGYAPRVQFTELYVSDGEDSAYIGLYMWVEKIRQSTTRVSLAPTYINEEVTSFIIAKDGYRTNNKLLKIYGKELYSYAYEFIGVYPKTTLSEEQANYIGDTITEFERNLYHDKYDVTNQGYENHIDVDSFIDYYIVNEFFLNVDAGSKSTFMFKDVRGKLHLGPVWDFNNGLGGVNSLFMAGEYQGLFMHDRIWFDKLLKDRNFSDQVIMRYKLLRQGPLNTEKLLDTIDHAHVILSPYARKDHFLYENELVDFHVVEFLDGINSGLLPPLNDQGSYYMDFDEEIEKLKTFIIKRGEWLDQNIESIIKWTE